MAGSATTVELLKPLAREHVALEPRSEHYAPAARSALHHLERQLFEAEPGTVTAQRRRAPARGRRRARGGRARRRLGARAAARRDGRRGHRRARPRPRGHGALRAGVRDATASRSPTSAARRSPTPASAPACWPSPARRSRRHRDRRRDLAAHARQARPAGPRGPARGAGPPRTRPRTAADAPLALEQARRPRARTHSTSSTPRPSCRALLAEAEAIWTAPHVRRADVLDARGRDRRARRPRAALRGRRAHAARRGRPGRWRATPRSCSSALGDGRGPRRRHGGRGHAGVLLADPLAHPRAPLPRRVRVRPAGGRAAAAADPGAVPRRRRARRAGDRLRARAAAPRGHARPRALAVLRVRLAARGGAVPLLPQLRRGGRAAAALAVPGRRARAVHRRAVDAARPAAAGRGHVAAGRGADAARAAPRLRRAARSSRRRAPLAAPATTAVLALLAARDRESARGLETFAGCPVRWLVEHVLRPQPVDPDPEPMQRGSLAHAVLERTLRGLQERTGSARARRPRRSPRRCDELARRDRRAVARPRARVAGRAAAARAGGRPRALPPPRGGERRRLRADRSSSGASTTFMTRRRARVSGRVDRIDTRGASAIVRDYKGRDRPRRRALGGGRQAPGRALRARRARALRASRSPARSTSRSAPPTSARAAIVRDDVPGRYVNGDVGDDEQLEARARRSRARSPPRPPPTCAPAGSARAPTAAPTTAAAPTRAICRAGAPAHEPRFTAEQRAAIEARTGSSLLAANAGSGKTAVMVERFAEAVRDDGVAGRRDPRA